MDASVVVDLMTGLCAIDTALAQRAADHLFAWPSAYGLDAVLVPATRALLEMVGPSCAAAVGTLRSACLAHLSGQDRGVAHPAGGLEPAGGDPVPVPPLQRAGAVSR